MSTPFEKAALTEAEYAAMEKELYEESIQNLEERLKDLQNGTLDEFVGRCKDFEAAMTHGINLAGLHRTLLLRNISELLAFDLEQIETGYTASLEALESSSPRDGVTRQDHVPSFQGSTLVVTDSDDHLRHELEQSERRKHVHFSMNHLKVCVPSVTTIQTQLQALRESLATVNDKLSQATHVDGSYDDETQTVHVGRMKVCIGDSVVLTSELAQEDYYGTIHAMNATAIHLHLVCGNAVQVTLEALRDRRCRLRFQDNSKNNVQPSPSTRKVNTTPRAKRTTQRKRLVSLI